MPKKENIALIDTTQKVSRDYLERVAAALQKQVSNDFAPVWDKDAVIHVFEWKTGIPVGFWKMLIVDEVDVPGVNGYHWTDKNEVPFAQIQFRDLWSLTASHELLEMLANPYVNRTKLVKGMDDSGQDVEFLVEVADPVEDDDFGYYIDGVMLSNFYYPAFFDLMTVEGKKYDHLGWLKEPRKLLNGGYISWRNAAGEWWQGFMVEGQLIVRRLGDKTPLTTAENRTVIAVIAGVFTLLAGLFFIYKFTKRHA